VRVGAEDVLSLVAEHVDFGEHAPPGDAAEGVIDQFDPLRDRRLHLADHTAPRRHRHRPDVPVGVTSWVLGRPRSIGSGTSPGSAAT
jgi:hypothetical protein